MDTILKMSDVIYILAVTFLRKSSTLCLVFSWQVWVMRMIFVFDVQTVPEENLW